MSVLKDNGYQTMSSGKTHFYPERICLGFEQLKKYEAVARESADDYHEWLYRESRGRICDLPFSMDPNAACTHIDTLVGKLMSRLENSNSLHNTWIIFASDHGEMLGDHNMFAKGNPLEASCRIPLVIKPPKEYCGRTGIKSELPVTLADIMPNIPAPLCSTVAGKCLPTGRKNISG
jgi:arylsulfatase A-like enzyme